MEYYAVIRAYDKADRKEVVWNCPQKRDFLFNLEAARQNPRFAIIEIKMG